MTDHVSVQSLLQDRGLITTLSGYLEDQDQSNATSSPSPLRDRYDGFNRQLSSTRFILPVAGVQGAGKSTMLNAIAFPTRVLPADVDETTCVPIEICWHPNPDGTATVHYKNGHSISIAATEDSLARYAHNIHNEGNEGEIDRVVVHSNAEVLRHGLVLVDLPGIGSLTAANRDTTHRYLREAVGAIFMLRTVPPITKSDALFIGAQWGRLPKAYFLQNRWNDETDAESEDGADHNRTILQAERNRLFKVDAAPDISVVNAHTALLARFRADQHGLAASGLTAFLERLEAESREWKADLASQVANVFRADLQGGLDRIAEKEKTFGKDAASLQTELEQEDKLYSESMAEIDRKGRKVSSLCDQLMEDFNDIVKEWDRQGRRDLRNVMRTKLRAGIVDGPRLSAALRDEQAVVLDKVITDTREVIMEAEEKIRSLLKSLTRWDGTKPDIQSDFHREEATKWENLAPSLGSAAVGLGVWMAAGAEIGAAVGTLIPIPLVGTIAGAVVGVIGGLLGGFLGSKAKQLTQEQRAESAEAGVFDAIDRYMDQASRALEEECKACCSRLRDTQKAWKESQEQSYEKTRADKRAAIGMQREEKDQQLAVLTKDRALLLSALKKLETPSYV